MATIQIDPEKLALVADLNSDHFKKLQAAVTKAETDLATAQSNLDKAREALANGIPEPIRALFAAADASKKGSRKAGGASTPSTPKAFKFKDIEEVKAELEKKGKISWRPERDAEFGKKIKALIGSKKGYDITLNDGGTWENLTVAK